MIAAVGNVFYFITLDADPGFWVSDGTVAGTYPIPVPGLFYTANLEGAAAGSLAFFNPVGTLYRSDGTAAGTRLVRDVLPGAGSSHPQNLARIGHLLFFAADDGVHGLEPWRSDGTAAGTVMVGDIAPGELPSSPSGFTASGPYVYFAANDGVHGFEPWAFSRAGLGAAFYTLPPCRAVDTRGGAALRSGAAQTFASADLCGIPPGAQAVAANFTVVAPTAAGYLTLYPTGTVAPLASNLNYGRGQTRTNNAILPLTGGGLDAVARLADGGGVDLVLDVVGYFQ